MINFVGRKNIFFIASLAVILAGVIAFFIFGGLNLDLDFKGGTSIRLNISAEYTDEDIKAIVSEVTGSDSIQIVKAGNEVDIRTLELSTEKRDQIVDKIIEKYKLDQSALLEATNISASASTQLIYNAFQAIGWAVLFMLIYITIRFDFKSGIAAILGLVHNILVMLSVYAIFQIRINSSFIAAILTIVGYSINDTIVIFDKIRENAKRSSANKFPEVANVSLNQSLTRTLNTSLTTLITILTLYLLGVDSIREFSLPIIIGVIVGTYSSICIATPLWSIFKGIRLGKKASK